ncbi:hypothetical protein GF327_01460 [Candidatus Woesearchaeota archaeon]|nr:hypothetical protein [Candidatus Woesearchaeota archaeon]
MTIFVDFSTGDYSLKNKKDLFKYLKKFSPLIGLISFLILLSLFIISKLFSITDYGISIATIAASLYVIISESKTGSLKTIFLSYVIAGTCAFIAVYTGLSLNVECGIAALLTLFTIISLDMMHPPSIAISISFVLNQYNLPTITLILIVIFLLFVIAKTLMKIINNPDKFYLIKKEKINFNFKKKEKSKYLLIKNG